MISKRKLICYDANSPKLVYLLMVTVFPFEVQFISNLGIVKPEPAAACLARWYPFSLPSKTCSLSTVCKPPKKKKKSCRPLILPTSVSVNGKWTHPQRQTRLRCSMRLKYTQLSVTIFDCCHKMAVIERLYANNNWQVRSFMIVMSKIKKREITLFRYFGFYIWQLSWCNATGLNPWPWLDARY